MDSPGLWKLSVGSNDQKETALCTNKGRPGSALKHMYDIDRGEEGQGVI